MSFMLLLLISFIEVLVRQGIERPADPFRRKSLQRYEVFPNPANKWHINKFKLTSLSLDSTSARVKVE